MKPMIQDFNILFYNVGRRGELIECFKNSGASLNLNINIIGCDISPYAPGFALCDFKEKISPGRTENTKNELLQIIYKHKVNLIIHLMEMDLLFLDSLKNDFDKLKVNHILPSSDVIEKLLDKRKMTTYLTDNGIKMPKIYRLDEITNDNIPLFIKPYNGWGSIDAKKIDTLEDLKRISTNSSKYMITEFIQGEEYTIDCYRSYSGQWTQCASRIRHRIRSGEVLVGEYKNSHLFFKLCKKIGKILNIHGPYCVQAFLTDSKEIIVFEVNIRFCGGMPVTMKCGLPFTDWLLEEIVNGKIDCPKNPNLEEKYFVRLDRSIICNKPWK